MSTDPIPKIDVFEQAAIGIAVEDLRGQLLEANQKAVELFGYSREELQKLTFFQLTHPDDFEATKKLVDDLLAERIKEYALEKRYIRKDGTEVWSHTTVTVLKDHNEKPIRMVGVLQDITARKNTEEGEKRSHKTLRDSSHILEVLNRTGAAIASKLDLQELLQIVTDAGTEISGARFGAFFYNSINENGEEFLLFTLSGAPREAFEKFGHPRATPLFGPTFRGDAIIRSDDITKDPRYGKLAPHHGMPKGHLPVKSYLAVPVRSRSGVVIGGLFFGHPESGVFSVKEKKIIAGIAAQAAIAIDNAHLYEAAQREISDRKTTDRALKEIQSELLLHQVKLESIIKYSEDAIITKDLQGIVQSWNPSAERIFGHSAAEAIGRSIQLIVPPELYFEEVEILGKISRGERVEHLETQRVTKDGRKLHISITSSPIKDADGTIIGATKIARDVTEQRNRQAAIEQSEARYRVLAEERKELLARELRARKEVERANQTKDHFLATLSHELRTPLNAILGWAQLARRNPAQEKHAQEALAIIERNARSQAQIIEDLLDMNRIASGTLRLDKQTIDLSQIVDEAIETVMPSIKEKNIELEKTFDCELCPVEADPNRMKQIVWNILTNAVKFTPKEGKVTVSLTKTDGSIVLDVVDTGQGIDPDFLPYIFDRFSQADPSSTRIYGGLGLGLSIVRHLVQLHGGIIEAKSEGKGQGAAFKVALPLTSLETPVIDGDMKAPLHSFDGLTFLVVDDEADARKLLKMLLEDGGATVSDAGSVAEAVKLYEDREFDLIISDIGMPNEDGHSLMRKIRAHKKNKTRGIPAIALTAYATSEDRVRVLEAGFQAHLAKPVEPSELFAVIKSLTDLA